MKYSESFPYLSLARYFEVPYWTVLCYNNTDVWGAAARFELGRRQTIHDNVFFEKHLKELDRRMGRSRVCPKCGTETDWPEGSGLCPEYHGRTGDGYCPIFVDGLTREQQRAEGTNGGPPVPMKGDE